MIASRPPAALPASIIAIGITFVLAEAAYARQSIRRDFFEAYPAASNTRLDRINGAQHCGVCHYDFNGGGPRNPYGLAVEGTPNRTPAQILALGALDSDGDGYSNDQEILDPGGMYINAPTFPGLNATNYTQVTNINVNLISGYIVPIPGIDSTPPVVAVISPNGGETWGSSLPQVVQWTATDNSGSIGSVDIFVTYDGVQYVPIGVGLSNNGALTWFVPNRPSVVAKIRVEATDPSGNIGTDVSDAAFSIVSTAVGRVPTTLRDFDLPGSQPFDVAIQNSPAECRVCHGDYNSAVEPYFNWRGSMMAAASIDPIFLAGMEVANQDAPESGDLCLRCHTSRGWLDGRSTPTNGSQMKPADKTGVSCDLCHRSVDPIYEAGVSPIEDEAILAALHTVPTTFASGQFVVDPSNSSRRGPFADAIAPHDALYSPFHREAAICGTCHDVSNPVFVRQPDGSYLPGPLDQPATVFGAHQIGPVERTYSEWFLSAYNTPQGVYNPVMGGNRDYVASCQDCHMRAVTGRGCYFPFVPERDDMPLHDMTGGSTWLPTVLAQLDPTIDQAALSAGIDRALFMLQNAAQLEARQVASQLEVKITNKTGHKLPTGYPEGRRMWLHVRFYDGGNALLAESGYWNPATGQLVQDPAIKIYEAKPVVGENIAPVVGLPANSEFHMALNNKTLKDNRIPPLGFTNAAFDAVGAGPVGAVYVDGQNWDFTFYAIPRRAVRAEVRLLYQSISSEFVEFLRDNGLPGGAGQQLYDLWVNNGKCPPEEMASVSVVIVPVGLGDNPVRLSPTGFWRIGP